MRRYLVLLVLPMLLGAKVHPNYVNLIDDVKHKVQRQADQARKDKDIIKLNCLNDKLRQISVYARLGRENFKERDVAHRQAKWVIMYQKTLMLEAEADHCVGAELMYFGKTQVQVEIDPSIPKKVDTVSWQPFGPLERPPLASTWR